MINTWVRFHQHFMRAFFVQKCCAQLSLFTFQLCNFWWQNIFAKFARNMLMKLTPHQESISSTFFARLFHTKAIFLVMFWLSTNFCTKNVRIKCWWNWHQNSEVWDGSEHNAFSPRPHHSGREEGVDLRCPDYVSGFDTLASKQGSSTINIEYTLLFLLYMPSMENIERIRSVTSPCCFWFKIFFWLPIKELIKA